MVEVTCGSCRWHRNRQLVDTTGPVVLECFLEPVTVPKRLSDFCSHHEERRASLPPVDFGVAGDVESLGEAADGMVGGTE